MIYLDDDNHNLYDNASCLDIFWEVDKIENCSKNIILSVDYKEQDEDNCKSKENQSKTYQQKDCHSDDYQSKDYQQKNHPQNTDICKRINKIEINS